MGVKHLFSIRPAEFTGQYRITEVSDIVHCMVVFLEHCVRILFFVPAVQAEFPDGIFTGFVDLDHPRAK